MIALPTLAEMLGQHLKANVPPGYGFILLLAPKDRPGSNTNTAVKTFTDEHAREAITFYLGLLAERQFKRTPGNPAPPLTKEMLDDAPCAKCGTRKCGDPVEFTGRCHPGAPVVASYTRGSGVLTLVCATCKTQIVNLAIK